ncbi:hypothetical protein AB0L99_44595 [Streptomyces sp. NPDC051954]|uniref:hypothetical protein n=1 Tax=Streptomyces sp. NPDC051954 TaxID=3155524 RepID=UPI0034328F66
MRYHMVLEALDERRAEARHVTSPPRIRTRSKTISQVLPAGGVDRFFVSLDAIDIPPAAGDVLFRRLRAEITYGTKTTSSRQEVQLPTLGRATLHGPESLADALSSRLQAAGDRMIFDGAVLTPMDAMYRCVNAYAEQLRYAAAAYRVIGHLDGLELATVEESLAEIPRIRQVLGITRPSDGG